MKLLAMIIIVFIPSIATANQWEVLANNKGAYIVSETGDFPTSLIIGESNEGRIGPDIALKMNNICRVFSIREGSVLSVDSFIFNGQKIQMELSCPYKDMITIGPKTDSGKEYIFTLIKSNKPIQITTSYGSDITFKNANGSSTYKRIFNKRDGI